MDTNNRPNTSLPARLPAPPAHLAARMPASFPDLVGSAPAAPSAINMSMLLRGLMRNWWRIMLVWLVISSPLVYLIYRLVEPTYEATSTLRIEPSQPELFGPSLRGNDTAFQPYLETQRNLILTEKVLRSAMPNLVDLPIVKNSTDPNNDIRKGLEVKIIPRTFLIQVSFNSTNNKEAADVVNEVVRCFQLENQAFNSGLNKVLIENYTGYLKVLDSKLNLKQQDLIKLAEKGNVEFSKPQLNKSIDGDDSPQPAFKSLTPDQYKRTTDQLLATEIDLIDAESRLQAKLGELQARSETPKEDSESRVKVQVVEAFRRDPEVALVLDKIHQTREELEHAKGVARKSHDPARLELQKRLTKLKAQHDELWAAKSEEIRARLLVETGAPGHAESINELKQRYESLRNLKNTLMQLLSKYDTEKQQSSSDTVKATFLRDEVGSLTNMNDAVKRKLEQLNFESSREMARVYLVDRASTPSSPSNNKRIKYMALLPVGVLLGVLGLFLLLEVKAGRIADPDFLSSRVQSEVYALPPLPTRPAAREPGALMGDAQIDQFIQRLDHLRFAICGDHHDLELGRCILVTSAVGGEGKTTLAAQLAARCGNAGISTLLIDGDLRRSALSPLLDITEGRGLSDVLKGETEVDEVVIPVQGGTFHFLPAGTPVADTSRIIQGRNVAILVAQLRQRFEIIIIDAPPILPVPDALILGRWTDGALLTTRFEISRSAQIERARRQLDNAGIPVLGTVINGMRSSESYYGRYAHNRQWGPDAPPPASTQG